MKITFDATSNKVTGVYPDAVAPADAVAITAADEATLESPGGWGFCSWDGSAVTYDSAAYTAYVNALAVTEKIGETKAEAKRRIIALFPGADETNYHDKELNAMMQYLDALQATVAGAALTAAQQTAYAGGPTMRTTIDAIRAASNSIEADIQASTDPANYDVTGSPLWP